MDMKKIIAGSLIAGMGIMGIGTSVAFANDTATKEGKVSSQGTNSKVGSVKKSTFDDVALPKDTLLGMDKQTHFFWILSDYNGVPIIKYAAIGEDRIEGIDKVVDQVNFTDDEKNIKEQVVSTDISATALPSFVAPAPKEVMKEWASAMKKKGHDVVEGDSSLATYKESLEEALGEDGYKELIDTSNSDNLTFVFLDEENLSGKGSLKVMDLKGKKVYGFSSVKANGEDNGDGMTSAPRFMVSETSGNNKVTAGNID